MDGKNSEYQFVKGVKERYEQTLLRIGGVVGVGIGREVGERHVIVVNVSGTPPWDVPFSIEGISVRVEYVGKVKPL